MDGIIQGLKGLGVKGVAAMLAATVITLAVLAWLATRAADQPMGLLYGDLDQRDAGQVIAALDRQRIPYRLVAGGSQIMAPVEEIAKIRITLAREGIPAGGTVGYEIFDRTESLTTTPFQQDVNRLRALEGELSRSIRVLQGVRAARVHLVLPRRDSFTRDRSEAQASVVLTMVGSQRLDRDGVQAVLHLVATAVPGLRPQSVSIVDSRGELLARGGQAIGAAAAGTATQEELRRSQEMRLARSVEELLERTLGPGRVRAEATVDMDFDRIETREERFDPESQVARSQQSVTENSRGSEPANTSVANNLPNATPDGSSGASTENRQEETTNYEISKTTRSTLREHPIVKRISIAVLVDGVVETPQNGGETRWRERNTEELGRIAALVRSAVGFDERRGDRVEVVSMQFTTPEAGPPPNDLENLLFGMKINPAITARLIESALYALVALLAILLVARPIVRRLGNAGPRITLAATAGELPIAGTAEAISGAAGAPAITAGAPAAPAAPATGVNALDDDDMVSIAMIEGQMKASSLKRISELVERHPDDALSFVRNWMAKDEED
jgi:flagellar M-ring protein FliF